MKRKKNGFTLIELLAVIVILAIIALIATPIILGIIEDTKKDAFQRSVELVLSSTDLDVMDKMTESGYEYQIVDGKISDNGKLVLNGYVIDKELCLLNLQESGMTSDQITSICNDEPQENLGNISLTETVDHTDAQLALQGKAYLAMGIIKPNYNSVYKDLSLAKNLEGMSGIISYTKEGKEEYAIYNGTYCVRKTQEMAKAEIIEYVEGNCSITKNLYSSLMAKVPKENDIYISGSGQLINLGEYGIRYQGNPDNYVYFNCSDYNNQTEETCEIWRIIGIVDGKVKLIRSESIGEYAWDENGGKNWENATLKTYLNGEYLESMITKNSITGNMISPSTWYWRKNDFTKKYFTKTEIYDIERTTEIVNGQNLGISENTKVGLMYPSDFAFSSIDDCIDFTSIPYGGTTCVGYIPNIGSQWLITGDEIYGPYGLFSNSSNGNSYLIFPTIYLDSNVTMTGEGTITSPYQLSM